MRGMGVGPAVSIRPAASIMVGGLVSLPAQAFGSCLCSCRGLKAAVAVRGAAVLRGGLSRSPWTGVGSWQDALCGAEGG